MAGWTLVPEPRNTPQGKPPTADGWTLVSEPSSQGDPSAPSESGFGELLDIGRLGSALVLSRMLGIDPHFAYQNHEMVEKQLTDVAGDFTARMGKAAIVKDDLLFMAMKHQGPQPFESHDMLENFVHDVSEFIGDPVLYGPAIAGALLGSPRAGADVGFVLDAGLRKALADHYEKGDVKSFGELTSRVGSAMWAASKGLATGEAMNFAGGIPVPKSLAPIAQQAIRGLYQSTAMTTAGAILDWRVPKLEEFERSAVMVGGLGLVTHAITGSEPSTKQGLLDVYANNGTTPSESAVKLQAQPPVKPEQPEGLRPAIRLTAKDGSKQVIVGDEGETHSDLAERLTGERPVTIDELEADAAKRRPQPYIEGENAFDRANRLSKEPTTDTTVGDTTYRSKLVSDGEAVQIRTLNGGKEIGGMSLSINPNGEGDDFAISTDLEINESERGKGSARKMYDNLLNVAKQYGIRTIQGEGVQTGGGKAIWESLVRDGKAYKTTDQYDQEVYRMKLPEGEVPAKREVKQPTQSLIEKVLNQPEIHEQSVIDRAFQLKDDIDPGEERYANANLKSGRGFSNLNGDYLNRNQARNWVKSNEPDVHELWSQEAGGDDSEFHSQDYNSARQRVAQRNVLEGDPDWAQANPELANQIAQGRAELNEVKAGNQGKSYGKEVLRTLLTGIRNMVRSEAQQVVGKLKTLVPDKVDRQAITFMRDYRDNPQDLQSAITEIQNGDNEKLKSYIPAMERSLSPSPEMLEADKQMTAYFAKALSQGKAFLNMDSSIDPSRYSPRLFNLIAEESEGGAKAPVKAMGGGQRFSSRTPHSIQREYFNILDPLKSGDVEARTFDSIDELSIYGDRHAKAMSNSIFSRELLNSELGMRGNATRMNEDGEYESATPSNWVDLPGSGRTITKIDPDTGDAKTFNTGIKVPPDVAKALRPLLEGDTITSEGLGKAAKVSQGFIKSLELGLVPFHLRAMALTFINNAGIDAYRAALSSDNNSPQFESDEKIAAGQGVTTTKTSAPFEAYRGIKNDAKLDRNTLLQSGIEGADKVFSGMTKATFEVAQRKFKVIDFTTKRLAWEADHPNATPVEYGKAMRGFAKEINAAYGGLNWEVMGVSANWQAIARLVLLAPDWTFSNFVGMKYAATSWKGTEGTAARWYLLKSLATGYAMSQGLSIMMTGKSSDQWDKVHLGTDSKGKEMYTSLFFAGLPKDFITLSNHVQKDGLFQGFEDYASFKLGPFAGAADRIHQNKDFQGKPITNRKDDALTKTGKDALFLGKELVPAPFTIKDMVERAFDPNEDVTYKDFLAGVVGAQVYHEKPKSTKFTLKGAGVRKPKKGGGE